MIYCVEDDDNIRELVIYTLETTCLLYTSFPFSDMIIKLAKKLEKEDDSEKDESRVLLDERMMETPGIALQSAVSEVMRMGSIVMRTMNKAREVMFTKDYEQILEIKEDEPVSYTHLDVYKRQSRGSACGVDHQ